MRRFITSLPGKVVSQIAVAALILPTLTLAFATRATAQVTQRASWAVVPFTVKAGMSAGAGSAAAEKVYDELAKRADSFKPPIDIVPIEQVKRTEETLGLTDPITDSTSLLRLGQELHATRLITGQIVDSKIETVGGNRQADVLVQLYVRDVASGIDVNGASVQAFSTVRAGNTTNEALLNEAYGIAANKAVSAIQGTSLPTGTLLNTQGDTALVNQGSRSGFRNGQQVIVTRNREQVATAHVFEVDFDSSQIRVDRPIKGLAPGDKVSVIFVPSQFRDIGPGGTARMVPSRNHGNNSGIISAILVLGLAAVLLSGNNGNGTNAANEVNASATFITGTPANKVMWSTHGFFRYTGVDVNWQIYRGVEVIPVGNAASGVRYFYDTTQTRPVTYAIESSTLPINGTVCNGVPTFSQAAGTGVTVGRQFTYRVELVYQVNQLDLPGGGSSTSGTSGTTGTSAGSTGTATTGGGGTTGGLSAGSTGTATTGGGSTGTATTGGSTTGGGTGGAECYFISGQTTSHGGATAVTPPQLNQPANGATLAIAQPFSFSSVVTGDSFVGDYVLQFSLSPGFPAGSQTVSIHSNPTGSRGTLSISADPTTLFTGVSSTTPIYWRVGGKNVADRPGPLQDPPGGLRYVFSQEVRSFFHPSTPPPPPTGAAKKKG